MAIAATTAWEVRTTGSDSNGGGFNTAATGTDFSQQDSPQVTYTDLVIGATTTQLTSAAHPFIAAHVGNIINITAGTGFTVGRYQVSSVSGVTATMDRAVGTAASTGGTGSLGGGMLTIQAALDASASSNLIWIKTGTYTITTAIVKGAGGSTTVFLNGYGSTHGDFGTAPLITTSTNSVVLIGPSWSSGSNNISLVNLSLSSTAATKGDGVVNGGNFTNTVSLDRCTISGVNNGIGAGAGVVGGSASFVFIRGTEIANCAAAGAVVAGRIWVQESYIHGSATQGLRSVTSADNVTLIGNLIVGNTGSGVQLINNTANVIVRNTFAFNGVSGVGSGIATTAYALKLESNIFYGNGAYGFEAAFGLSGTPYIPIIPVTNLNNAYGANTTAALHNLSAGQNDVTLTANPFTNSGAGNYTLNSVSGGGAACKGAGYPGAFPGGTTTGGLDIGAVQSVAGSGGGGSFTFLS